MVGKIQRVGLREVWKHETLDFTTWLEENIDVLNDVLGFTLVNAEREQSAGNFSVDLVAEDDSGNLAIIENQLERSDHDHLGKLITYLAVLEAKSAIWIVSEPRAEHVRAVSWLNESSAADFYLVKVEAIRIDDSAPAPLLTLITGPSKEAKQAGDTKRELAERHKARLRFWTGLLTKAKEKTSLHANISPSHHNWVGTSAGLPGLNFNYVVRRQDAQVELYIDADRDTGEGNKAILRKLLSNKNQIEDRFGGELEWELLEGRRACRIKRVVPIAGWQDDSRWPEAYEELIATMIRFSRALQPYLKQLKSK